MVDREDPPSPWTTRTSWRTSADQRDAGGDRGARRARDGHAGRGVVAADVPAARRRARDWRHEPPDGRRRPAGRATATRFVGTESPLVYLDGNSLGRPLTVTGRAAARRFVEDEWGGRLIRGWDERWFDLPLTLGDELGRVCLGAAPGPGRRRRLHDRAALQADARRRRGPARAAPRS